MAVIRHMREADAADVARLFAANASGRQTADVIAADMRRPHSESFVADDDGRIVGYVYARVARRILWLDRLHVAEGGLYGEVGRDLLHAVMVNYVGEPSIAVMVAQDDGEALDFYRREGFEVTGETAEALDGVAAALILRRPLARA